MNIYTIIINLIAILNFNLAFTETHLPKNFIYMVSSLGDSIGENQTHSFDDQTGNLELKVYKSALYENIIGFSFVYKDHTDNQSWFFKFKEPFNNQILIGKEYKIDAFDMCALPINKRNLFFHSTYAIFKILDYEVNEKKEVTSLAIDFRQIKDKHGNLHGCIRYQSSIPVKIDFNLGYRDADYYQNYFEIFSDSDAEFLKGRNFLSEELAAGDGYKQVWDEVFSILRISTGGDHHSDYEFVLRGINGSKLEKGIYRTGHYYNSVTPWHSDFNTPWFNYGRLHGPHADGTFFGSFEVLEIERDENDSVVKLSLDFAFPSLKGTIRYNTSLKPRSKEEIEFYLKD